MRMIWHGQEPLPSGHGSVTMPWLPSRDRQGAVSTILLALLALPLNAAECLPVTSDYIRAGDFALADSGFSTLPPDQAIIPAPNAGVVRALRISDVRAIAARRGITSQLQNDICFEWPMRRLADSDVREAMLKTLASEPGDMEILEISTKTAPSGKVEFDQGGLREVDPRNYVFLWNGFISYAPKRRFPVWSNIKLAAPQTCVFATEE